MLKESIVCNYYLAISHNCPLISKGSLLFYYDFPLFLLLRNKVNRLM